MFPNPKYLTHPNIPKPLHGVNPRSIKGQAWWDIQRQKAYETHDYHCWACGIHKLHAKYHQWLEAHEEYQINYNTGKVLLKDIIALCHSCHNFIHSGRLYALWNSNEWSTDKCIDILNHGFEILESASLEPYHGTQYIAYLISGASVSGYEFVLSKQNENVARWESWHLELDGKRYYSKFKNINEWKDYYKK